MARKQMNIEQTKLEAKGKAEGYLLSATNEEMAPYSPGQAPGLVPKLVLQTKEGKKISVLLGSAMRSDIEFLKVGAYTWIQKGTETKGKRGSYFPYTIEQDEEMRLNQ